MMTRHGFDPRRTPLKYGGKEKAHGEVFSTPPPRCTCLGGPILFYIQTRVCALHSRIVLAEHNHDEHLLPCGCFTHCTPTRHPPPRAGGHAPPCPSVFLLSRFCSPYFCALQSAVACPWTASVPLFLFSQCVSLASPCPFYVPLVHESFIAPPILDYLVVLILLLPLSQHSCPTPSCGWRRRTL